MSKYIPKVGEEFEWSSSFGTCCWKKCGKVLAETDSQISFLEVNGDMGILSKMHEFRPIPSKADAEREQLHKIIDDNVSWAEVGNEIQKAGFTIPKKVKRSDVVRVVYTHSEGYVDTDQSIIDEFCELLGDLVERDL